MESRRKKFDYIYGPVASWRLGSSLGIDPISSNNKICTFDCVYCQLGPTATFSKERKVYVKTEKIAEEIKSLPPLKLDYITFSGRGEPTLATNLGELIRAIRSLRKERIAVLTNSTLMDREDVREDLSLADFVIAKLDAVSQETLEKINKPVKNIKFENIIGGIKKFKKGYKGRLALRIMFTPLEVSDSKKRGTKLLTGFIDENKSKAKKLASIAEEIKPDEVQINTPLRPCRVRPLSENELSGIKEHFLNISAFKGTVVSVYESMCKEVLPISLKQTLKRRGKVQGIARRSRE